jgi:TRAP-type uncharacterized transport system fused permease subunit
VATTNGQLTPPVMGAAAFLMVEYVGIGYFEVIKHAFLPAIISYIALVYIVHLEAVKADMKGLPKPGVPKTWQRRIIGFHFGAIVAMALALAVYYLFGWIPGVFGAWAHYASGLVIFAAYLGLVRYAASVPDLELDDPDQPPKQLFFIPALLLLLLLIFTQRRRAGGGPETSAQPAVSKA